MMSDLAAARAVQSGRDGSLFRCLLQRARRGVGRCYWRLRLYKHGDGWATWPSGDPQKVAEGIANGVQAFGMTLDQIEKAVPMIVDLLLQQKGDS